MYGRLIAGLHPWLVGETLPRLAAGGADQPEVRMNSRFTFLALALAGVMLGAGEPAHGQRPDEPAAPPVAGDRVRLEVVTLDTEPGDIGARWTGRLLGADSLAVHVRLPTGDSLHVAREDVRRLQVWVREGRETRRGLSIGMALGGIAGGTILSLRCIHEAGSCPRSVQANFAVGFALGAVPGGAIGALVGWAIPGGRWQEASQPAPAPPPAR